MLSLKAMQLTEGHTSKQPHCRVVPAKKMIGTLLAAWALVITSVFTGLFIQPADLHTLDFVAFWAASQLPQGHVYDVKALEKIQHSASPLVESKRFIRPPFYALMVRPLGYLPLKQAYYGWFVLNLAALFGFVRLWAWSPGSLFGLAFFSPLFWSFGLGQDVPLLLFTFAASVRLFQRRSDILGGAALSLCLVKPNIFGFVLVVLFIQRRYRALASVCLCGFALAAACVWSEGWSWPGLFVEAVLSNEHSITPKLISVVGLLSRFGFRQVTVPIFIAVSVAVLWFVSKRAPLKVAAASALMTGVLCMPHVLIYDGGFTAPLLLCIGYAGLLESFGIAYGTLILSPAYCIAPVVSLSIAVCALFHNAMVRPVQILKRRAQRIGVPDLQLGPKLDVGYEQDRAIRRFS